LSVAEALGDPVALATWHEALSDALRIDIPHDLLALWLFPTDGGVVLLGPEALAQDQLNVPVPSPCLRIAELTELEGVVSRAGFVSVVCLPIRFGRRDVGLLLVAALQPGRFDAVEQALLHRITQRLASTLGRLARLWRTADDSAADHEELVEGRLAGLIDRLSDANRHGESPRGFAQAVSRALESLIPHDHLELLIPSPERDRWFRLGEHVGGRLWADPALILEREQLDVGLLFGSADRMIIADTYADRRWPRGFLTAAEPAGAELRSLAGVAIPGAEGPLAYLLLGSVGPGVYREEETALLRKIAGLLVPRVELFVRIDAAAQERLQGKHPLAKIAELLATATDPIEALGQAAEEARLLVPFHGLHYALRLTDDDRVVLLEPGERRPLADLPLVPVAGTALAEVIRGVRGGAYEVIHGGSRLIVPLRLSGQVHGAVVLTSPRADAFNAASVTSAQRYADLLAPHFELLRRTALSSSPYVPGWKRAGR
jgi:putative methionine-R-sulfoxide reductase with GAF domain